jgi:Glycosyl hydrolase family 76
VRRNGVVSLLVAALALLLAAGGEPARDITKGVARSRAIDAYSAMQRYFYSPADGSYAGAHERPNRAQAWPFSQALWATLDIAAIPKGDPDARADLLARIRALAAYSRPEPGWPAEYAPVFGGSGVVYNDDNLWIAQALVGSSSIVGGQAYATARNLFRLVEDSWDMNAADPCPGGVFWTRQGANRDRNAVTTANASLLALRLYERSGSPAYLTWAQSAYAWTKRCLGTQSGLVNDHIDLGGKVDPHTWSYNQGAMIAAGVRLYRATGRRSYLDDATRTANAALRKIGDPLASGEPPVFLAIFYRDLLELTAVVPGRVDRDAVSTFADEAWQRSRDAKTGLFHFAGRGPTLLDQAAMVQVYAELGR